MQTRSKDKNHFNFLIFFYFPTTPQKPKSLNGAAFDADAAACKKVKFELGSRLRDRERILGGRSWSEIH